MSASTDDLPATLASAATALLIDPSDANRRRAARLLYAQAVAALGSFDPPPKRLVPRDAAPAADAEVVFADPPDAAESAALAATRVDEVTPRMNHLFEAMRPFDELNRLRERFNAPPARGSDSVGFALGPLPVRDPLVVAFRRAALILSRERGA